MELFDGSATDAEGTALIRESVIYICRLTASLCEACHTRRSVDRLDKAMNLLGASPPIWTWPFWGAELGLVGNDNEYGFDLFGLAAGVGGLG